MDLNDDQKLEWGILEYIAEWTNDRERPSNNVPFVFPEVLRQIPTAEQNHVSLVVAEDRVRRKLDELTDAGFLATSDLIGDDSWILTRRGHEQLEAYRDTQGWRWWKTQFGKWADRIFASILTPILVTILTVIVMQYLGLNE